MKRLTKLASLNEFLRLFRLPGFPDITPIYAVGQGDATGRLAKAQGDQLVIAMPESMVSGNDNDSFSETLTLAFFALCKSNPAARTGESEDEDYSRTLAMVSDAVSMLDEAITGAGCGALAGLGITSVSAVPEYSIFGGWSGWSVEISLG